MFVDPLGEVVAADEAIGESCDGIPVDKEDEKRHTPHVKSVDKRRIIAGIDRSDRDRTPTGEVAENGLHALTDATAAGVELHERDARLRDEPIEFGLTRELGDSRGRRGLSVSGFGHT